MRQALRESGSESSQGDTQVNSNTGDMWWAKVLESCGVGAPGVDTAEARGCGGGRGAVPDTD